MIPNTDIEWENHWVEKILYHLKIEIFIKLRVESAKFSRNRSWGAGSIDKNIVMVSIHNGNIDSVSCRENLRTLTQVGIQVCGISKQDFHIYTLHI